MNTASIRLKTLRQLAKCDPEPFCPSPAYASYTNRLVDEGLAERAQMRRGFHLNAQGRRELTKLEAVLLAAKRRTG